MRRTSLIVFLAISLITLPNAFALPTTERSVSIRVAPENVLIQEDRGNQFLNFDFSLTNISDQNLSLRKIEMSAYDLAGNLLTTRRVDSNGTTRTAIATTGVSDLPVGVSATIFNPVYALSSDLPIDRMEYRFDFTDTERHSRSESVVVRPTIYKSRTALKLPVRGRYIIDDGNDFYSHHRRLDLQDKLISNLLSVASNFSRYAYDLVAVDSVGKSFRGEGRKKEDWYGYGQEVFAPAPGKVVVAINSAPEESDPVAEALPRHDASLLAGNYVIIDHENGEFSAIAHLIPGSVTVKAGEHVKQGQVLGKIGLSGSTGHPHLHYELRTSYDFKTAEGLPSYFVNFRRIIGDKHEHIRLGTFNTGDLIENDD